MSLAEHELFDERGPVELDVMPLGETRDADDVWAWLPDAGDGWLEFSGRVARYDGTAGGDRLLNAEVVEGKATTIVRFDCGVWRGWRLTERDGGDVRFEEQEYLSTAPASGGQGPPTMRYRTYWRAVLQDGVNVWQPFAARFCGWNGGDR